MAEAVVDLEVRAPDILEPDEIGNAIDERVQIGLRQTAVLFPLDPLKKLLEPDPGGFRAERLHPDVVDGPERSRAQRGVRILSQTQDKHGVLPAQTPKRQGITRQIHDDDVGIARGLRPELPKPSERVRKTFQRGNFFERLRQ